MSERASKAKRLPCLVLILAAAAIAGPAPVPAETPAGGGENDSYFECAVTELPPCPMPEPEAGAVQRKGDWRFGRLFPRLAFAGGGEAVLAPFTTAETQRERQRAWPRSAEMNWLFLRVPAGATLAGTVYIDASRAASFGSAAASLQPSTRERFLRAKIQHYEDLARHEAPGAAWFRYKLEKAEAALRAAAADPAPAAQGPNPQELLAVRQREESQLDETFALLSGGRAVSENLRLDRELVAASSAEPEIDVAGLPGIDVRAFDWTPLIAGKTPRLDRLAAAIPADQHALFFPDFGQFLAVVDEADRIGTPILFAMENRAEDAHVRDAYEEQLCLSTSAIARLLGDSVIASVAITGSDPYFRTGTDLALLFEPKQLPALHAYIAARHAEAQRSQAGATPAHGEIAGLRYSGVVTPDRRVSSYTALAAGAVVVTNSLAQLERIGRVAEGVTPALSTLDEYTFFRDRYPLAAAEESALLVLSDATIRRWCGARWRIAASRRTRAAAYLLAARAAAADALAEGKLAAASVAPDSLPAWLGAVTESASGVRSSIYGTPEFLTPIVELAVDKVTGEEAAAYERFRATYQREWRQFFDPIAVRVTVRPDRLALDTTVRPLIGNTDYREFTRVVGSEGIVPGAGDPHAEAVGHMIASIRADSEIARQLGGFLRFGRNEDDASPLAWLGKTIAVYLDFEPEWLRLFEGAADEEEAEDVFGANLARLPLAIEFASANTLKLTLFLTSLRAFAEQAAPGMCIWETLDHGGQSFVRISPAEKMRRDLDELKDLSIWYAPTADALIVSLREDVLKRALDRRAAANRGKTPGEGANGAAPVNTSAAAYSWLGESFALHLDRRLLAPFERAIWIEFDRTLAQRSFAALPILNEWKRLYPAEDPVAVHERIWQSRLVCPGGGEYRWNEAFQTMESTVYGHPARPRIAGRAPAAFAAVQRADFGLTFEDDGLRARIVLER
ncbi:MAG: hypothetical protein L0Z55_04890 [Planctomycetes bacterium]|nr:hypothetical protein [Planctomycetota bacterium]